MSSVTERRYQVARILNETIERFVEAHAVSCQAIAEVVPEHAGALQLAHEEWAQRLHDNVINRSYRGGPTRGAVFAVFELLARQLRESDFGLLWQAYQSCAIDRLGITEEELNDAQPCATRPLD